ncbi:MAG: alpha-galactosidase [Lachnospiraceae bacterium]|nr:alpha-galactosidase [Lachnospiraceae bacterium]
MKVWKNYKLGDMQAIYLTETDAVYPERKNMELLLLPVDVDYREEAIEKPYGDSLVQLKIAGDAYLGGYIGGRTMRQGQSVTDLQFKAQTCGKSGETTDICTTLVDERGYEVSHHLLYTDGDKALRSYTVFTNNSTESVSLEMLSSFSMNRISPFMGNATNQLKMHRLRSVWSMEGRLESIDVEDLQLEASWAGHAVRCERFGQAGSMPVNGFFPYIVMEDKKEDIFWGAQIAHNASWQIEVFRRGTQIQVSGGLADREFGHWMKNISAGESFATPEAILSVCHSGGVDRISQRLTSALEREMDNGPECEQSLPVMFNEYCTTWGDPSHANICNIVNAIKDKGFAYFVIDAGWYRRNGIPWDYDIGDYNVSPELFPEGLDKTVEVIKAHNMKPGIWFEIDNVGEKSKAYQMEEHLLHRDGKVLTTTMRRFRDMRQPWVQDFLTEKVIDMLKKYGFEYMKMDYNESIGIGCDGAESLGEGLRQNMAASLAFIEKVKEEIPELILENCSSGGHKLEPLMMSKCSMASFSDAHECEEIPIIALNLHRAILPRQSQIWAVIRETDSLKRIAYSMANTFLGRCCVSGHVLNLTDMQWDVLDRGIAFYKKIADIIKKGESYRFGPDIKAYRHAEGWQGLVRVGENGDAYVVLHNFYNQKEDIDIVLPTDDAYEITDVYSDTDERVILNNGVLSWSPTEEMKAVAVYLKKKKEY